ncbi:hypothetical protein [Ottowia sp. oral taxon 894]|uniref:hypothetical protein n=1 Tax=Ottowia sp. oral taxon 894 TaxID=1658672 RepID=UPI0012E15D6F|nr:hypothetical protein [Ottowia sp. oral taxon 894]
MGGDFPASAASKAQARHFETGEPGKKAERAVSLQKQKLIHTHENRRQRPFH